MATQTNNQFTEQMAEATEQFRKTATAAGEQARQTLAAAQEQLQQGAAQAQQARSDLAQTMLRLNEQNSRLVAAAFASFWDTSLTMLSMATWGQEQIERTTRQLMEQGHLSREEGAALVRTAAEQAQRQQAELARLVRESLRAGWPTMPSAGSAAPGAGDGGTKRATH